MNDSHQRHHRNSGSNRPLLATGMVLGAVATGLYMCSRTNKKEIAERISQARHKGPQKPLQASVHIDRSADDLYKYWHDFTSLPDIMPFLKRVDDLGSGITRWVAKASVGPTFVWESKVIDDVQPSRISWQSLAESDVRTWGQVQFTESAKGQGTDVLVKMTFEHYGDNISSAIDKFVDEIERSALQKGLENFKEHMETRDIHAKKPQKSQEHDNRAST